jgi:hypothetical protein
MRLWRGVTSEAEGYFTNQSQSLLLPVDEDVREYLDYLKIGKSSFYRRLTRETVVETVWDTFLKGYCVGLAALARKSQQQMGTENEYLFTLSQACNGGTHAHVRLRYAHQIRSDDIGESGLKDLAARYHDPPTDC